MPTKDELDRRLERYLDGQEEAERRGVTLGAVQSAIGRLFEWTQTHEKKDDARHDDLIRRLEELEKASAAGAVWRDNVNSDIRELKGGHREAMTSVHDMTERDLEVATKRHEETIARVWHLVLYVLGAVIMLVIAYFLGRAGIATH